MEVASLDRIFDVKRVVWSSKGKDANLAFLCKKHIVITDSYLKNVHSVKEALSIKSGVWNNTGVFIYCTVSHIKFLLKNGDSGIVRSIDRPIYITAVKDDNLFCLDREAKNRRVIIDTTEYNFKRNLDRKNMNEVARTVRKSNIVGKSIIGYLQQKGHPEIAIQFATDDKTRLDLAIASGRPDALELANQCAKRLDDIDSWASLGVAALKQGNYPLVKKSYRNTLAFEKLSSLFYCAGQTQELEKMIGVAAKRKDLNAIYSNAVLCDDQRTQIKVLLESGQFSLAYAAAKRNGFDDLLDEIVQYIRAKKARENGMNIEDIDIGSLNLPDVNTFSFSPLKPVFTLPNEPWPMTRISASSLDISGSIFEKEKQSTSKINTMLEEVDIGADTSGWDNEIELSGEENVQAKDESIDFERDEGDGWGNEELELSESIEDIKEDIEKPQERVVPLPKPDRPITSLWTRSDIPVDHIAAGSFHTAMQILHERYGIVNFAPLKESFLKVYSSSRGVLSGVSSVGPMEYLYTRNNNDYVRDISLPLSILTISHVLEDLQQAYQYVTSGKFNNALDSFITIMCTIPLLIPDGETTQDDLQDLIGICREYILGLSIELERKATTDDKRAIELAVYFSHCKLQRGHRKLTTRQAMKLSASKKNYHTAYLLARTLLTFDIDQKDEMLAQKILRHCEQKNQTNMHEIDYDEQIPFEICGTSFTLIYANQPRISCKLCGSYHKEEYVGKICNVCKMARLKKE